MANCASGRFFIADGYYAGATKKVKCLACSAGYALYTDAGAGSNVGATLCEISTTTYFDNFANCVAGVVDAAISTIANARCT